MSSSESDFEIDENSCLGYQYEPEYTEEELIAQSVEQQMKMYTLNNDI
jgi:hypothetical protein